MARLALFKILYPLVLVMSLIYILRNAYSEIKYITVLLYFSFIISLLIYIFMHKNWEFAINYTSIIDIVVSIPIFYLAFRSEYYWPMLIAALQFIVAITPFAKYMTPIHSMRALGIGQGLWSYFQLLILLGATYLHRRNGHEDCQPASV